MIKSQIKFGLLVSGLSFWMSNLPCQANHIDIPDNNLFCPHGLAVKANLVYDVDQSEFTAVLDGKTKKINKYDVSGIPSNLSKDQMESFLKIGYFSLNKAGEDFVLEANVRVLGGMKKASDDAKKLQQMEQEYEQISSFISRHPQGPCSWFQDYGGRYTGELANQMINGGHHDSFTKSGNTHCGGRGICQLPAKINKLQHLERMIPLYRSKK